jgi:hypothetical protein
VSAYETIAEYRGKGDAVDLKIYGFIEIASKKLNI